MDFQTSFKTVSAVEIHDSDYVVLLDNQNNVFAVFPRGNYSYLFWKDFLPHIVRDIDMSLYAHGFSKEFKAIYQKFFTGLRELQVKQALSVDVEALSGARGNLSAQAKVARSRQRDTKKKD